MKRFFSVLMILAPACLMSAQELHNRYGFTLDRTADGYVVHTQKSLNDRFQCNPEAIPHWLEVYDYVPEMFPPECFAGIDTRHLSYSFHSGFDYQMDIYLPSDYETGAPRPVALIVHHGVWTGGMRTGEATVNLARTMASRGIVSVAIGYSDITRGTITDAIGDISEAWSYIRANAPEWNVDPDRFAICGYSEGAHLAACASLMLPGVKALVSFGGIMNLYGMNIYRKYNDGQLSYFEAGSKDDLKLWSPTLMLPKASFVPEAAFIVHGAYDLEVPCTQSAGFVRALKSRKVKVESTEVKFGHHNLLRPENYEGWERIMASMTDFLWKMTGGK